MALVSLFALATIVMAWRRKEFLLAGLAVITGLFLAATGTDVGTQIMDALTDLSKMIDGLFTKK